MGVLLGLKDQMRGWGPDWRIGTFNQFIVIACQKLSFRGKRQTVNLYYCYPAFHPSHLPYTYVIPALPLKYTRGSARIGQYCPLAVKLATLFGKIRYSFILCYAFQKILGLYKGLQHPVSNFFPTPEKVF